VLIWASAMRSILVSFLRAMGKLWPQRRRGRSAQLSRRGARMLETINATTVTR